MASTQSAGTCSFRRASNRPIAISSAVSDSRSSSLKTDPAANIAPKIAAEDEMLISPQGAKIVKFTHRNASSFLSKLSTSCFLLPRGTKTSANLSFRSFSARSPK